MENNLTPTEKKLLDAWQLLQQHSENGQNLPPDSSRLAFSDPEFLQREETRGIRMQLEMLKPELSLNQYQIDNTIVVYGSARVHSAETVEKILAQAQANNDTATLQQAAQLRQGARYYEDARQFARLVAQHSSGQPRNQHYYICTGGGPGIMEAANRGASEAGEPSIGLNITLPHEQCANPYDTPALSFKFHYFALRKMHFMMRAKAIVTFPGGFGTLDELFEILTHVQTDKANAIPVVLYGKAHWQQLLRWEVLVQAGLIDADDINLFHYADSPEDAWAHISNFYCLG